MKRRLAAGGVLVAALGILIGTLTNFFGGFGGDGNARTSVDVSGRTATELQDGSPLPSGNPGNGRDDAGPPKVLEIIVDDRSYEVRQRTGEGAEFRTMELEAIVELAKTTLGDSDGVRVRIASRGSARYTAEARLHEALLEAGLSEESLRRQSELAP